MKRILFVCIGNCHRSPIAEAVANRVLAEHGLSRTVIAISRGTSVRHPGGLSSRFGDWCAARPTLEKLGIREEILAHRSRQLEDDDLRRASAVVAMDLGVWRGIVRGAVAPSGRVRCFTELNGEEPGSVPDPIGGDEEDFRATYVAIDRSVRTRLNLLLSWAS